jgi:integrase
MTLANTPGGNHCVEFSSRRKPLYQVLPHALPTGERFPILIKSITGVPPTFALRYALTRRSRGGAARLHSLLRGLADLYEWCEAIAKVDLDGLLLSGHTLGEDLLIRALNDVGRVGNSCIAGVTEPAGLDVSRVAVSNVYAHNRRVRAWRDFLIWALEPKNWSSGSHPEEEPSRRAARRDKRFDLELFFDDARRQEGTTGRRSGLTAKEVEAIELAIGPNEQGEFPRAGFNHALRLRNWVMFEVARWGGLRRGEILKLQIGDIPRKVRDHDTGEMVYERYDIEVVRRPDDPDDPRIARTPLVKRGSRAVVLPESLLDDLRMYIEQRATADVETPCLFVSETGQPLSIERTDDIIHQIGRYAGAVYEALHPGATHSLGKLSWHRLRHTRARELLPIFLDAGPTGLREFLEYFGWASIESADPYVRDLYRERAGLRVQTHNAQMAQHHRSLGGDADV